MSQAATLRAGDKVVFDGHAVTVVEFAGAAVVITDSFHRHRRVRLVDFLQQVRFPDADVSPTQSPVPVVWSDASEEERRRARDLAEHLREMLTGYRSGTSQMALPGEPLPEYAPGRSLGKRRAAKAAELGVSTKTLQRWQDRYQEAGEVGLLDGRGSAFVPLFARLDPRWVEMCQRVIQENVNGSRRGVKATLAVVRARLVREFPDDQVVIPSESAGSRAVKALTGGTGAFIGATKQKRSIANRPAAPYGTLRATRPGEYVLLDTNSLNVYAVEALTGRWCKAELTVAMDLFDRSILGLRLTPVSTKSIDVASVLVEAMTPAECPPDWGDAAAWPFHGVPDVVVVDAQALAEARFIRPPVLPETIITDHGKPFVSMHVTSVCQRLGISIQPARTYTPTDKSPVERFFRTIEELLQELPGYKGADVASRGLRVEQDSVYTFAQLEQIIREWIATVYHLRPHGGLQDLAVPGVLLSPAQKYEQGIALAGRLRVPVDSTVLLHMLPVERRQFNHYGVEVNKLRYTGEIVRKYHDRPRAYADGTRSWPFFINPDDMSQIYFHDPEDNTWHTLTWVHAAQVNAPFSLDALEYAKRLAVDPSDQADVADTLGMLLDRWGAGRAATPTERRISARMAAQLAEDLTPSTPGFTPALLRRIPGGDPAVAGSDEVSPAGLPDSNADWADDDWDNEELEDIELMEEL